MDVITPRRIRITLKTIRAITFISLLLLIFFSTVVLSIVLYAKWQGPPSLTVPQSTIIYASDGSKIGELHNGQKRYWVNLDDISEHVLQATIAIEDRSFYDHHGFDYKRIAGAALADLRAMAKVQGASTITQQYARNLFLQHEKTWQRKAMEAFYTIRLEQNYSKDEILEGYLNTIFYGHGVYGIEAAANYYFGKNASQLTLAEASMLAGIPKGPNLYSPYINQEKAKERQTIILKMMANEGYITEKQLDGALREKLVYTTKEEKVQKGMAPYFQDAVMSSLAMDLQMDEDILKTKGLKIYTTLDPDMQKIAEEIVASSIEKKSDIQAGFVAMDPKTGYVKALIGGRDYEKSPFNRATQAKRQPGSTIKPLLYYTAINNGFTPSTEMMSEPTTFSYDDGKATYKPSNYNDYYANDFITMLQAIALSDNIYAVKTHMFLGMDKLVKSGEQFGLDTKIKKVPSAALGTSPIRLVDIVNAYGMLGNGGKKIEPAFVTKVEAANGDVIYKAEKNKEQILNEQAAFVTTHMMTGMFDPKLNGYTSVTGQSIANTLTRDYAGKSGSTSTDSWMIGFSPQIVAGVWTGYDKGKSIDLVQERGYSKTIWARFMEKALEDESVKAFRPPDGLVGVYINPASGKLATKECPEKRLTYYVEGTEPTEYCTEHSTEMPKEKESKQKEDSLFDKLFKWWD
ncbi:transglycosylase domain-containing protein [Metabacillus sediminilitoris]|uniref:PBP1A family penicillin-binding protein n=1 Tax=Metabacillus sediminilitoris TaxID=2567941 RepID=A0A4S4BRH4_9BACI|nr:PBP1A family penicillin-binding protein [Metabacillus sediminilitoris]QGQ48382.1 PBP1A family penicillin-binding protein [Metabacillus sediminilitoris]THF77038.1 PBP1A family penicillin-binding protein [Metabacillus sediminilitoris]